MKNLSVICFSFLFLSFLACNNDDDADPVDVIQEEIEDLYEGNTSNQDGFRCQEELFTNISYSHKVFKNDDAYLIPDEANNKYLGKLSNVSTAQLPINTVDYVADLPNVDPVTNSELVYDDLTYFQNTFYIIAKTNSESIIFLLNLNDNEPSAQEIYRGFIVDLEFHLEYLYFIEGTSIKRLSLSNVQLSPQVLYTISEPSMGIISITIANEKLFYTTFFSTTTINAIDLSNDEFTHIELCCNSPLYSIQYDETLDLFFVATAIEPSSRLEIFRFTETSFEPIDSENRCLSAGINIIQIHRGKIYYNQPWRFDLDLFNL